MEVGLFLLLGGIGIDCRMVLVPCLWHIMWSKLGGYCRRWTRVVPGWFRVENGRVSELPRLLWHAVAWNPRRSVAGCLLWHAVAWNPRRSVAGCHFWHAVAWDSTLRRSPRTMITFQLRMRITSSSKLRFGCSWTLWKAH